MSYSSNLKSWGATGSEYPDGYSYVEGEPPVDEYDNFIMHNLIEDVQHTINEVNNIDVSGDIENHRATEVHDVAQPPEDHGNEEHTETYAVDSHDHDSRYYQPTGNDTFVYEMRSNDPASPDEGQAWIRDDL